MFDGNDENEQPPSILDPDLLPVESPVIPIQPDLKKEEPCRLEEEVRSTFDQPASFGDTVSHNQSEIPER